MKAYVVSEPGDISKLQLVDLPKPEPKADEVLVKVKAISINPVDAKVRQGKGPYARIKDGSPLIIIGWDISGEIEAVGKDVTQFQPGDAVFGMVNFPGHGKAYAEYVVAPAGQLAKKPANISFEAAAAATLAALTAYQILKPNLKPGDKALFQSAAGGVGHFAIQMAKILGVHATGITSTKNVEFVKSLGADEVIDYTVTPFENARDFDFALDTLSGEMLLKMAQTVREGGILFTLPSGADLTAAKELTSKRHITLGFRLVESNGDDMKQIANWLASGELIPEVSEIFEFTDLPKAHQSIESGHTKGKIVIRL
jgi:NADPH:quinone reductase-like Zn-dependent oxidoreductase